MSQEPSKEIKAVVDSLEGGHSGGYLFDLAAGAALPTAGFKRVRRSRRPGPARRQKRQGAIAGG